MRPILIFGGSLLFWVAVRGRFPKYSELVHAASPSPGAGVSSGGSGVGVLDGAAAMIGDIGHKVWNGFKDGAK